tara:strand:- start:40513 stop:40668 length:156 start_codon:yes stop_codon:yes gene_type:complete
MTGYEKKMYEDISSIRKSLDRIANVLEYVSNTSGEYYVNKVNINQKWESNS